MGQYKYLAQKKFSSGWGGGRDGTLYFPSIVQSELHGVKAINFLDTENSFVNTSTSPYNEKKVAIPPLDSTYVTVSHASHPYLPMSRQGQLCFVLYTMYCLLSVVHLM